MDMDINVTSLQRRMLLADLVVPHTVDENLVADWLTVLCTSLDGSPMGQRSIVECSLTSVIGRQQVEQYLATEGNKATVEWLIMLKQIITKVGVL